ncbi:Eukaryotic translation initiation factor 5A [Heterostelium album PN500]|uniref:Eukaryotic translation initiation factor 5A n=1 Tax=Heterostelium pallidum (strain ATCC 26659 / Pp 5 / PN500) TaxID=670386 RepID=D3BPB3_HETP5|nr:Eukaryotic translation initiation factor 5A [Heterostelium album PN500]EFA77123.1 Eukaryotic translation initiation factor 5A [Heterostelium album PN500]|eukprot:XP_020429252.1 Eukaryotic translation initiation factor 5A [Heterostelium album PN500]
MTVESIASLTTPMQASQLRIGKYCLFQQHPCKVVDMSSSGTGKHGKCKIHFVGIDIFTGKRYEHSISSVKNLESPTVDVFEYQLINIEDEFLSLLDLKSGTIRNDLKLPVAQELRQKIIKLFDDSAEITLSVISSMGQEEVISYKQLDGFLVCKRLFEERDKYLYFNTGHINILHQIEKEDEEVVKNRYYNGIFKLKSYQSLIKRSFNQNSNICFEEKEEDIFDLNEYDEDDLKNLYRMISNSNVFSLKGISSLPSALPMNLTSIKFGPEFDEPFLAEFLWCKLKSAELGLYRIQDTKEFLIEVVLYIEVTIQSIVEQLNKK